MKVARRQLCSQCRMTTTAYMRKACNVPLRIKFFGPAHEVYAMEDRNMKVVAAMECTS